MKKFILCMLFLVSCPYFSAWAITPDSSGQLQKKVKVSVNDSTAGFLNGKLAPGGNITFTENSDGGDETLTIAASGSLGYSIVQNEGTGLTQRGTVNMIGAGVNCVDNAGGAKTDCTISGASAFTTQEGDVNVDAATATLDFVAADFDVTSSPAGEANVALSTAVVTLTGTQTLTNKTLTSIKDASGDAQSIPDVAADTFALIAATQTLTNKTIDGGDMGAGTTKPAGGNTIKGRSHDTDCTAVTDGKANEVCYEEDDNKYFVCEPSIGDCDGASEWIQVNSSAGYSTIKDEGSSLTARTALNFIGSSVACVDNASQTECTVSAGSATVTVQEDDVSKDAAATTLDFDLEFTVTSSPAGEANIDIKDDALDFSEFADAMTADPTAVTVTDTNYLRLGDGGSNYVMFGANGAVTYGGAAKPGRTIDLTPSAALSPASNGATKANTDGTNFSYPQASYSGTGTDVNSLYWTFFKMPDSYDDAATITCTVAWKTSSVTTGNTVVWSLAASGRADDELFDASLGSFATATDNPTTVAERILISPAITLTTNFTSGEYVIMQLKRDAADDTETAAAIFLGLACEFKADAETD